GWNTYQEKRKAGLAQAKAGDMKSSEASIRAADPVFRVPLEVLNKLRELQENVAKEEYDAATAQYAHTVNLNIGLLIGGVLAGVLLSAILIRSLVRQLGSEPDYAAEIVGEVAQGNLMLDIELRNGD